MERPVYPFAAIVNQDLLKLALLAIAVNPRIGGLLIRGEKGSGKSMIVRALADVLPEIEVVSDCPFHCNPRDPSEMCDSCRARFERGESLLVKKAKMRVITLPIGATEDMVVGTIDIERMLKEGLRAFEPGILARANRNILYIDEINLLPDHIVNIILDAAAMGWNYVERENISISHPARFILVGTMNPEEGDIRPQLLDRLSICVDVSGIEDPKLRVEIIRRNIEFSRNPMKFREKYEKEQRNIRKRIEYARGIIDDVEIPEYIMHIIASLCSQLKVDGHRPDIVIAQTAMALAALDMRKTVDVSDVRLASFLALIHRTRKGGLLEPPSFEEIHEAFMRAVKGVGSKFKIKIRVKERSPSDYMKSIMEVPPTIRNKSLELGSKHFFRDSETCLDEDTFKRLTRGLPKYTSTSAETLTSDTNERRRSILGYMKGFLIRLTKKKGESRSICGFIEVPSGPATGGGISFRSSRAPQKQKPSPARLRRGHIGLARVQLTKFSFPKSRIIRVSELMSADVGESSPKRRQIFCRSKTYARGSYHGIRGSVAYGSKGQYVTYIKGHDYSGNIAIVPTIISAIANGRRRITIQDLTYKLMAGKRRMLLLVVFDCSESMQPYVLVLLKTLLKFHRIAWRMRNLIGLIAVYGQKSRVLIYPTTNINKLIGGVLKLEFGGKTPLADGLLRAYRLITSMKVKYPDVIPRILLFSDGIANVELEKPIYTYYREMLVSPAQADVLSVARMLGIKKIKVVVVNPWHMREWPSKMFISPTKLLITLAKMSGGVYLGFNMEELHMYRRPEDIMELLNEEILEEMAQEILDAIFESLLKTLMIKEEQQRKIISIE